MRRAALLLLLLPVACSRGYRDPEDSAALAREIEDENVATRVRVALGTDPETAPYETIHVECREGVVRLTGVVDRGAVKRRAEEVAVSATGVRRVDNRITVQDAYSRR